MTGRQLPTDPKERVVFCYAFGDHYNGDNFDDALRYAWFAVTYTKGMKLWPFADDTEAIP